MMGVARNSLTLFTADLDEDLDIIGRQRGS